MEAEREQGKFKKRSMKKDYSTHLIPEHHQLRLTERNAFYALLVQAKKSISYFDCTQASEEAIITASERLEAFARPYQKNGEKLDAVMEDLARQAHPNSRPPLTLSDMLDAAHETFIGHRNEPSQIMPLIHQLDIDPAHMTISNLPLARDLSQQTADNKQGTAAAGTTRYIPKIALALSALYENGMSADQHLHYILTDKKSKDPLSGHKDKYIVISAPDLKIQLAICERVDAPTYVNRTLRDYTWWQQAAQGQIKTFDELPTIPAHLTAQGWTRALNAFLETPAEPAPTNPPPPTAVPEGTAARFSLRAIIDESMAATLQAHPPVLPRQPLRKKKALPPQLAQPSQQPPHLARPAMLSPASLAPHADLNPQRTQSPPISLRRMIDESIVEAMKTHAPSQQKVAAPANSTAQPVSAPHHTPQPEELAADAPASATKAPVFKRVDKYMTPEEHAYRLQNANRLALDYLSRDKLPSRFLPGLSPAEKKEIVNANNFMIRHVGTTLIEQTKTLLRQAAQRYLLANGPSPAHPTLTWAQVDQIFKTQTGERHRADLFDILNLHGPKPHKKRKLEPKRVIMTPEKRLNYVDQLIYSTLADGKLPTARNPRLTEQQNRLLGSANTFLKDNGQTGLLSRMSVLFQQAASANPQASGPSPAHPTLTWTQISDIFTAQSVGRYSTDLFKLLDLPGPPRPALSRMADYNKTKCKQRYQLRKEQKNQMD